MVLKSLTSELARGINLSQEQVIEAVGCIVNEQREASEKAEFLIAFAAKGESAEEIGFFAKALRSRAVEPPIDEQTRKLGILDVCGTGGDRMNTFNISTTV